MIRIYMYGEVPNSEIFARRNLSADVSDVVSDIIDNVRKKGDTALFEYTQKFDGADLINLEVTEAEKEEAFASVDSKFLEILREAADNIRAFHEKQVRESFIINNKNGILLGQKIIPIEKVGIYVPEVPCISVNRSNGQYPGKNRRM